MSASSGSEEFEVIDHSKVVLTKEEDDLYSDDSSDDIETSFANQDVLEKEFKVDDRQSTKQEQKKASKSLSNERRKEIEPEDNHEPLSTQTKLQETLITQETPEAAQEASTNNPAPISLERAPKQAPILFKGHKRFSKVMRRLFYLPKKQEAFIPRTKIKITKRPVKTFFLLTVLFSLLQKMILFPFLPLFAERDFGVGIIIFSAVVLYTLWPVVIECTEMFIPYKFPVFVIHYAYETLLLTLMFIAGFQKGLSFFLILLAGNIAGDFAMIHHCLSKKYLRSWQVFMTTNVLFAVTVIVLRLYGGALGCPFFLGTPFIWFLIIMIGGTVFGLIACKQVLLLDKRLKRWKKPIGYSECLYYAMTLKFSAGKRQIGLFYSKLFSE